MISEELFIKTIDLMKKKRSDENAFISALELCSPQEYVNAFIYSEYEDQMARVLHEALELPAENDILEYWLWDLSFGKDYQAGCYTDENGKDIDISTVEKLYDYIRGNK